MRIGVITDIHSNVVALEAVFEEFEKRKIKKIICSGDSIGLGPRPEETMQLLMRKKDDLIYVKGNHEKYFTDGLPEFVHDERRVFTKREKARHIIEDSKLSKESGDYIRQLPEIAQIVIEGKKIYVIHYPTGESGHYKKHIEHPTIEENIERFSEIDADIFLYGHTHTRSVCTDGKRWYINAGSLGCPKKENIARAGILSIEKNGINFEELNIEYDVQKVVEDIKNMKYPTYEKILSIFYGQ